MNKLLCRLKETDKKLYPRSKEIEVCYEFTRRYLFVQMKVGRSVNKVFKKLNFTPNKLLFTILRQVCCLNRYLK